MGVTVGLGLATTALALRAMGMDEFGLYGAVFAVAGLTMLVSDSLGSSTLRRLSLHVNSDERQDQVKRTMATCLSMVLLLAALPVGACFVFGNTLLSSLQLNPGREGAAWWTLQIIVAGFAATVVQMPYRSLLMARQELVYMTIVDVLESIVRLSAAVAATLLADRYDPLLVFAAGALAAPLMTGTALVALCVRRYPVARSLPGSVHPAEFKELVRFAGWDVVLGSIWRVRMQGSQILLNWGYGTAVNAANSIALQASNYQNSVAMSIYNATRPAIMTRYGSGDLETTRKLVLTCSKYMMLMMLALLIPLAFEGQMILRLWLGKDIEHAPIIVFLTALWIAVNHLSTGHIILMYAVGKLRRITLVTLGIELVLWGAAAAWIFAFDGPVWSLMALTVVATAMSAWARAAVVGPEVDLPVSQWLSRTVWPVMCVSGVVALGAGMVHSIVPELLGVAADGAIHRWSLSQPGMYRLLAVLAVTAILLPLASWFLGIEPWERTHFTRVGGKARSMILGRFFNSASS